MADDFKKLLDEQKKTNEILSAIDIGQQKQGDAKEIVKQALPEIANERQLASRREKFDKKTGKTDVDDKVDKLQKTVEKQNKKEDKGDSEERLSRERVQKFLEKSNSTLLKLYNLQFAFAEGRKKMDEATRKFNNAFFGGSRERNVKENKAIKLEEERLQLQKTEIERRGGNAEKDAQYRIDMLALERRKARLERRNRSGFLADSKAAAKNRFRQLKELVLTRQGIYLISDGIKGLVKGLFRGAGRAIAGGFGLLKKLALAAFIPAVIAFLNSEFWEKTKVFIVEKLIPAVKDLFTKYIKPFAIFLGEKLLDAWELIKKYFPIILDGVTGLYNNYIKPFGSILVNGLKSAFGKILDFFLGRSVAVGPGGQFRERTGEGLFGIIGGVIDFFRDLPDTIATQFTNIMEKIKGFFDYVFSFDILADIYDRVIGPFFPNTPNPFRNRLTSSAGFDEGQSSVSSSTLMGDAGRRYQGQSYANVMNTITDGTIAQEVQRAMNRMRQASGDIDDLGTAGQIFKGNEKSVFMGLTEGNVTQSRTFMEMLGLRISKGIIDNLSYTQTGKFNYAASPTIINAPTDQSSVNQTFGGIGSPLMPGSGIRDMMMDLT